MRGRMQAAVPVHPGIHGRLVQPVVVPSVVYGVTQEIRIHFVEVFLEIKDATTRQEQVPVIRGESFVNVA